MKLLSRKTITSGLILLACAPAGVIAHEDHAPHHWESAEVQAQLTRQTVFLAGAFLFVVSATRLMEIYRRQAADEGAF